MKISIRFKAGSDGKILLALLLPLAYLCLVRFLVGVALEWHPLLVQWLCGMVSICAATLCLAAAAGNSSHIKHPLNEQPIVSGYDKKIVGFLAGLRKSGVATAAGIAALCQEGITHIYVGQGQGSVSQDLIEPLLNTQTLNSSSHFRPIYRQDKVAVFQFNRGACVDNSIR